MSIEEDIQQKSFRSEYQKVVVNLIYTYNWVTERIRTILAHGNITEQQYNILRILRGAQKPLSTLQIRKKLLDKASDTSRIVDRMVLKNLVTKTVSTTDKRLVDISISEAGLELLSKLDAYNDEMDSIVHNITEEEARNLNMLLDKIREKK